MKLVKVDATSSTNSFLKEFVKTHAGNKNYCIIARHQVQGRGQRGTSWQSDPGKNLTFSVYLSGFDSLHKETFKLSALVALALIKALEDYDIPKLSIKWPNDILSRQYKIGGILIENMLTQQKEGASIIGVGLNVNQEDFPFLPKASSLKNLTDTLYNLEDLLQVILDEFELIPNAFNTMSYIEVMSQYYNHLYKYGKVSMFQFPDGTFLQGLLRGVDNNGRLIVEFEEDRLESYDIKEIQIKY